MRDQDYITEVRRHNKDLWSAINSLKILQREWNAKDYGTTLIDSASKDGDGNPILPDGGGENKGILKGDVGAVVFGTTDAVIAVLDGGHATNMAQLL